MEYSKKSIDGLIKAMAFVLNDMGPTGNSVCRFTKAKATLAFEPFQTDNEDNRMSLTEAVEAIKESDALLAEFEDENRDKEENL